MTREPRLRRVRRGAMLALMLLVAAAVVSATAIGGSAQEPAPAGEDRPGQVLLAGPDADVVEGSWVVILNEPTGAMTASVAQAATINVATANGATVTAQWDAAVNGFSAEMSEAAARQVAASPNVAFVEQNRRFRFQGRQDNATWGLDRIDQRALPLNGVFDYPATGAGVNVYVIDSGVNRSHNDFTGRVRETLSFVPGEGGDDCNGHGTHVTGTIASETWGVAKDVDIYSLKVGTCDGVLQLDWIINGVNWVAQNRSGPSVANLSLGGPGTASLDQAVRGLVNAGVVTVVAAGNSAEDACGTSPAREPMVITVGSTSSNDNRSDFSNHGSCLDIWAPGTDIRSTSKNGGDSTEVYSGTSMASPHVAGVAALILEQSPNATPADVWAAMLANGTSGVVGDVRSGSPNVFLFADSWPPPPPPPEPIETRELVFEHSNRCVDIAGASRAAGANVQQWRCAGVPQQRFDVLPYRGDNVFALRATHSDLCLDVRDSRTDDGTNVRQMPCRGSDNQLFSWSGSYLVSALASNKCLDLGGASPDNGGNVQLWGCADVPQQRFLNPSNPAPDPDPEPEPDPDPDPEPEPDPVPGPTTISGAVTDNSAAPVSGVAVDLFVSNQSGQRLGYVRTTRTDANGQYRFDLDVGCWAVTFIAPDGLQFNNGSAWLTQALCIDADGGTANAVLLVPDSEPAIIGDSVTDSNGVGVGGVSIDLFSANADGSRGTWLRSTVTTTNGSYQFETDPGCYVATFIAPDDRTFLNGSQWSNVSVCVAGGETVDTVDAVLRSDDALATVGGTVTKGGIGFGPLAVDLFEATADGGRGEYLNSTASDATTGAWSLDVTAGCYAMTFIAPDGDTFTNGSPWYTTTGCVAAGETLSTVNAALAE